MSQKGRTKDEAFLLTLRDEAQKMGSWDIPMNRYEIGAKAGMQKTAVDTICKLLYRTNFIRNGDEENTVYLTQHGYNLVERLHHE